MDSNVQGQAPVQAHAQELYVSGKQDLSPAPTEQEQIQYKVQLLLHINSILLARVIQMTQSKNTDEGGSNSLPEHLKLLASQYLKRVHANLQCISQINQGSKSAKPIILDPPQSLVQQPAQDILVKLYLLMSRVFEIW